MAIQLTLAMLSAFCQVLIACAVVDMLTGVYHYVTDRGWNHPAQVAFFQAHHETNAMGPFDWQPMLAGFPAMAAGLWLESPFLLAAGSFGCLAQVPHYYAHHRSRSPSLYRVIRWLQRTGIIISPQHHAAHHRGAFDCNFCVFTGWSNWWMNRVLPRPQGGAQ